MEQPDRIDTTNALLDRYAQAEHLRSDYALAKSLGCTTSTISNYRKGKTKLDHTTAVQIAERLRLDPLTVIAKLTLERPHTERDAKTWRKYSGRLLLAAVVALTPLASDFAQNTAGAAYKTIHYTHRLIRLLRMVWRRGRLPRHPAGHAACPATRLTVPFISRCDGLA